MVHSKLVTVRDEGTHMVFLVTKFEHKDEELINRAGWDITPKLCVVTALGDEAQSVIGTFKVPSYDIPNRTGHLSFSHTTAGVVEAISSTPFEDIPDVVDARDYENWMNTM